MNPGAESMAICLTRQDTSQPWGFRLQGGTDFTIPLSVQNVNPGSLADRSGLKAGDAILQINNRTSDELEHEEAKREILMSGLQVNVVVQRGAVKVWKPKVTPMSEMRPGAPAPGAPGMPDSGDQYIQRTSLAADKSDPCRIGSAHNRTARPFAFGGAAPAPQAPQQAYGGAPGGAPGGQYGAPGYGGAYGEQTNAAYGGSGMANQQAQQPAFGAAPAAGGAPGAPGPVAGMRSVRAPSGPPANVQVQQAQHMVCKVCGSLCVGVFVKVKGEPMHPECYKCVQCAKSLKNQGFFTIEGQLYCDDCATNAAPPPGQGMTAQPVYR